MVSASHYLLRLVFPVAIASRAALPEMPPPNGLPPRWALLHAAVKRFTSEMTFPPNELFFNHVHDALCCIPSRARGSKITDHIEGDPQFVSRLKKVDKFAGNRDQATHDLAIGKDQAGSSEHGDSALPAELTSGGDNVPKSRPAVAECGFGKLATLVSNCIFFARSASSLSHRSVISLAIVRMSFGILTSMSKQLVRATVYGLSQ